jgi:2-haloacid dehalogenase
MADERWVTFDCYGTLVDWWTGMGRAVEGAAGERAAEVLAAYHLHELQLEAERPAPSYRHVLREGLRRAANEVGVDLAGDGDEAFVRAWPEMPVFDDVGAALTALREAGWRLAILTNCDDDLIATTQKRLPAEFDMVVTAEQVGAYKPDLAHFRRFSERAGVGEGRWVHAACSWIHDVFPAARMGTGRVWVDRDRSGHPAALADRVLPDMRELPEAVEEVAARRAAAPRKA